MLIRIALGTVGLLSAAGVTYAVRQLKPAAPTVEFSTVWPDTVKRGPMLREVRGLGTLVPEQILFIPAQTDGRIERINLRAGQEVRPDTVILELTNPELTVAALTAEYDLKVAEATLVDLRVNLQSQGFDKESAAARVRADYNEARLKAERDEKLLKEGLISQLDVSISASKARELGVQNGLEERRLKIIDQSVEAQIGSQKVKIEQLRALYDLKRQQIEQLKVRAGISGVLLQLGPDTAVGGQAASKLEAGQRVTAGSVLAKIAQPEKLKAELKITETQAKDIALGQPASIDTRNGVIPGKVTRIDPAAVNGTVAVDVALLGKLPPGARPDLSVDGTVELEKLTDIVFVGRPTSGQPNSSITLFRIDADRKGATRVRVKLGRASVSLIEVMEGLLPGDQVILSDMSAWDSHDRIRLN
jgi:HlyD family secretion protein